MINLWKFITAKVLGTSFLDGISWEPQLNTHFYVVDKRTGQVRVRPVAKHGVPSPFAKGCLSHTLQKLEAAKQGVGCNPPSSKAHVPIFFRGS